MRFILILILLSLAGCEIKYTNIEREKKLKEIIEEMHQKCLLVAQTYTVDDMLLTASEECWATYRYFYKGVWEDE